MLLYTVPAAAAVFSHNEFYKLHKLSNPMYVYIFLLPPLRWCC